MSYLSIGSFDIADSLDKTIFTLYTVLRQHNAEKAEILKQRVCKNTRDKEKLIRIYIKELTAFIPPFTYVGHAPNDESNWGVWVDLGKLSLAAENGQIIQADKKPTKGRSKYVLLQEDGRLCLFQRRGWIEVWKV